MPRRRELISYHLLFGLSSPVIVYCLLYWILPDSLLLKNPLDVLFSLRTLVRGDSSFHIIATLTRWLSCLTAAVLLGVIAGTLARVNRHIWLVLRPAVDFLRSTPAVTYAAFCMILVPLGMVVPVTAIVANGTIMIVYTALALEHGLKQEDRLLVARCLKARGVRLYMDVILPGALPVILDGVQVIVSLSLIYTIMLEAVIGGSRYGIGVLVFELKSALRLSEMYALIYVSGVLGFAANVTFSQLRSRLHPWVEEGNHE